jgi:hypothetical protein
MLEMIVSPTALIQLLNIADAPAVAEEIGEEDAVAVVVPALPVALVVLVVVEFVLSLPGGPPGIEERNWSFSLTLPPSAVQKEAM